MADVDQVFHEREISDHDRKVAQIDEQVFHEREMSDNDREAAKIEENLIVPRCISTSFCRRKIIDKLMIEFIGWQFM